MSSEQKPKLKQLKDYAQIPIASLSAPRYDADITSAQQALFVAAIQADLSGTLDLARDKSTTKTVLVERLAVLAELMKLYGLWSPK